MLKTFETVIAGIPLDGVIMDNSTAQGEAELIDSIERLLDCYLAGHLEYVPEQSDRNQVMLLCNEHHQVHVLDRPLYEMMIPTRERKHFERRRKSH